MSACCDSKASRQEPEAQAQPEPQPKAQPKPQQPQISPTNHIIKSPIGGSLMYLSLLRSYKDHIVGHVWISQPKDELKLVSHGGKVMHYPTNSMMKRYVDRSRLKGLYDAQYMSTNKGLRDGTVSPPPSTFLQEKVLRQFGYAQWIPQDPSEHPEEYEPYCQAWAE